MWRCLYAWRSAPAPRSRRPASQRRSEGEDRTAWQAECHSVVDSLRSADVIRPQAFGSFRHPPEPAHAIRPMQFLDDPNGRSWHAVSLVPRRPKIPKSSLSGHRHHPHPASLGQNSMTVMVKCPNDAAGGADAAADGLEQTAADLGGAHGERDHQQAASAMTPVSRRTIRSAIVRCSTAGSVSNTTPSGISPLCGADPHPLGEQVHQQRRRAVHVVPRVRRLAAASAAGSRPASPAGRPIPAPPAARTRTRPTRGPRPTRRPPQPGHEIRGHDGHAHDQMNLSQTGRRIPLRDGKFATYSTM